jgi:polar amino acid transport system substrate-binding protein
VIDQVAARLGWHVVYKPMPWQRALRSLQLGQVDALSYLARTPERECLCRISAGCHPAPAVCRPVCAAQSAQRFPDKSPALCGFRMAAASNYFYGDIVQQAMQNAGRST